MELPLSRLDPMSPTPSSTRRVLVAALVTPGECLRGITQYSREKNWHLVTDMMFTGALPGNWKGDGVLALLPYQPELLEHIQRLGLPCVAFTGTDGPRGVPCIESDNTAIGRIAADHLLARAHRSFAWAPFIDDAANRARFAAFRDRLAEHGCTCHALPPSHIRIGSFWQDNWAEHRRSLVLELQRLPQPTAVFAFNDCVAVGVIDACRDAGLSVPDDVAVLGVGNSVPCEASPVPLSSIDLDMEEAGYRAAAMLDQIMNGERAPAGVVYARPKGIVTRVSTDVTAVTNPRVSRALTYIAENYTNPLLSVGDIADAVGTSRRNLERSFRIEMGCTIHEQIIRTRMQEASRLLKAHPRAKTSAVASLVGLAGPGTFFRTFRRYYGMSPKVHRAWSARSESSAVTVSPTETPEASQLATSVPSSTAA